MPPRGSARTTTRPLSIQHRRALRSMAVGMGFEYFYGFMGGETDQWTPYLFRDHTQIFPWIGRKDYNLTTDMADEAIKHMRDHERGRSRPAVLSLLRARRHHSPHQPKPEWVENSKGCKFDMGYEKLRDVIFANQKRLGVIPRTPSLPHGRMVRPPCGEAAEVGLALLTLKETLRAPGGGLCRLRRLYRL